MRPARPRVEGKFLSLNGEKLYLRGVTYGTFGPEADGTHYPSREIVEWDFREMAAHGINAVRTYTVPPRWLLDVALENGLLVMVGLPWEQHVAFLDDPGRDDSIEERVRAGVRACAGHPALLCYAVGNEIPAPIVRWHGRRRVERFLERLYEAAKDEDPGALVTYVNFPSTEYLDLPFLDFVCFNVYLEAQRPLEAYLARLHNLAGDRPLVMAEVGLDSRRNSEEEQARVLRWQIRTAAAAGCAGAFVFAWTDEWHRGGFDIEDWDFGLTRRDRSPKSSLDAVSEAFDAWPLGAEEDWPSISVVVCSCNGASTLRDCLDGLEALDYPDYEVILVNDGSTDATAVIAEDYEVRLINTENRGLSSARNTGFRAARGEIVAYIDDDARPDSHWLRYLAQTFRTTSHVGVGGPNLAPAGDGPIAECVANAPGGPVHVLLSDREAEHIPGCNMAVRKEALEAVGGFDPRYRVAGDDVDLCWRLQQRGWTLGFNPAAVVWHHRRNSLRAYWRQQRGYGRAEALLERKWPEKYNSAGHLRWGGRLYGKGLAEPDSPRRWRVYYGTWGTGLFQSVYQPAQGGLAALPLMPEWYLLVALLAVLTGAGAFWAPLLFSAPLLALALAAPVAKAVTAASRASFASAPRSRRERLKLHALTATLHLVHPVARLYGRLRHGLTPWRRRGGAAPAPPVPKTATRWTERWQSLEDWLGDVECVLLALGAPVRRGGDFDRWDLEVRGGMLGRARLRMGLEEHGAGKQLARFRAWPVPTAIGVGLVTLLGGLAAAASLGGSIAVSVVLACACAAVFGQQLLELSEAMGKALAAVEERVPAAASPAPAVRPLKRRELQEAR